MGQGRVGRGRVGSLIYFGISPNDISFSYLYTVGRGRVGRGKRSFILVLRSKNTALGEKMGSSRITTLPLPRTSSAQPVFENGLINTYRQESKSPKEQILILLTLKGNLSPQQLMWYLHLPYDQIISMLKDLDQEKKTYSHPSYNGGPVTKGTKWFLTGRERFNRVLEEMDIKLSETPRKFTLHTPRFPITKKVLPFPLDREIMKKLKKGKGYTIRKICYLFKVPPTFKNIGAVRAALGIVEREGKAHHTKRGKHSKVSWFVEGG